MRTERFFISFGHSKNVFGHRSFLFDSFSPRLFCWQFVSFSEIVEMDGHYLECVRRDILDYIFFFTRFRLVKGKYIIFKWIFSLKTFFRFPRHRRQIFCIQKLRRNIMWNHRFRACTLFPFWNSFLTKNLLFRWCCLLTDIRWWTSKKEQNQLGRNSKVEWAFRPVKSYTVVSYVLRRLPFLAPVYLTNPVKWTAST